MGDFSGMLAANLRGKTLSVSQITDLVKELLEGCFPTVTVEGEISNYRPSSTGHVYFTLKDENAAISAVMFKGKARMVAFSPRDGMRVKVGGSLSVYAQRGSYQIVIDTMELSGAGDILRLLEERKQKLAAEGLFDSARKKPLPRFPQTVGVVTSPTGAALQDILNIIRRRNSSVSVIVLPCAVQGAEAADGIVRRIQTANVYKLCDVLIIGRGGGSLEDLLPFSEEAVVRAVAASEIPTVSAVGHEIDWALSDFAADVRAPTPSAAAELVTPLKSDIENRIAASGDFLQAAVCQKLERFRLIVKSFSIDSMELRFRSIEQPLLQRFDDAKENLLYAFEERVKTSRHRLEFLTQKLEGADPKAILLRGFSMVRDVESGKIIHAASDTVPGARLEIIPARGVISATVTETSACGNEA